MFHKIHTNWRSGYKLRCNQNIVDYEMNLSPNRSQEDFLYNILFKTKKMPCVFSSPPGQIKQNKIWENSSTN